MHPLVRQVALRKLQGSRGELERRAALAVTHFICHAQCQQAPARQDQTAELKVVIDWVEAELHNLIAAADFAFAARALGMCTQAFTTVIFDFFQVRGHWAEPSTSTHSHSKPPVARTTAPVRPVHSTFWG